MILSQKHNFLNKLLKIKKQFDDGTAGNSGLCRMLEFYMLRNGHKEHREILHKHFQTWKHYSGKLAYPIGLDLHIGPMVQYDACIMMGANWQFHKQYIAKRIDLLNHIIRELGREIYLESTNGAIQ